MARNRRRSTQIATTAASISVALLRARASPGGHRRRRLDQEGRLPDLNAVTRSEHDLRDPMPVHSSPVGGAEVGEDENTVAGHQPGVPSRGLAVTERELALRRPPDPD